MNDRENPPTERWALAFDASCGQCRAISGVVARETAGRIEVLSLSHADVESWRKQALGSDAPWAPTLLRIRGTDVRAWTGPALGLRLVGRLGLRATARLLRALSDLRRAADARPEDQSGPGVVGRARFLRLGAGFGMATTMILTGRTAALAGRVPDGVDLWLKANLDRLPQHYDEVVRHPMAYRRAIFAALPRDAKRNLWLTHLEQYRRMHPRLTPGQNALIDRLVMVVTGKFGNGLLSEAQVATKEERRLEAAVLDAFGQREAKALVATLGPDDVSPMLGCKCDCSTNSNYCWSGECRYLACRCRYFEQGCGFFWSYACDGYCSDCESCQP